MTLRPLHIVPLGLLLVAACSEGPPTDLPAGPFRGVLFEGPPRLELLPADPSDPTADVEVASAPPRDLPGTSETEEPVLPAPPVEEESVSAALDDSEPDEPAAEVATLVDPEPVDPLPEASEPSTPEGGEDSEELAVDSEPVSDEILLVNFDDLADFDYEPPTIDEIENGSERPQQIPDEILELDRHRVEVEGYMVPMEVEKGKVKSFILSRTLSGCCFGDMPNILEWIDVRMAEGKSADYVPYAPVLVIGRLSVGEVVDEYGITSVYRMTAESVEDPW